MNIKYIMYFDSENEMRVLSIKTFEQVSVLIVQVFATFIVSNVTSSRISVDNVTWSRKT